VAPVVIRLEGESMLPPAAATAPTASVAGAAFSGGAALSFQAAAPGDKVTIQFSVTDSGTYALKVVPTAGPRNGTFTLALDGQDLGGSDNTYYATLCPAAPLNYGQVSLAGGAHSLTLTATAKDPKSAGYWVGLDYLELSR
jgi:hypothetical protein